MMVVVMAMVVVLVVLVLIVIMVVVVVVVVVEGRFKLGCYGLCKLTEYSGYAQNYRWSSRHANGTEKLAFHTS